MSLNIIEAGDKKNRHAPASADYLQISEFFADTIQGEGIHAGHPAAFLRLQGCTLDCQWCDTSAIWKKGSPWTFQELFALMEETDFDGNSLISKFAMGQHLVLTGGSPLLQQERLIRFISEFIALYGFKPFIEIENECTLDPLIGMVMHVDTWNNSPKLISSGNPVLIPNIVHNLSNLENSWFKFVVTSEADWVEIKARYLVTNLIDRSQVILMPQGATFKELAKNRETVIAIAIKNNVKYSTREHVVIWGDKAGV